MLQVIQTKTVSFYDLSLNAMACNFKFYFSKKSPQIKKKNVAHEVAVFGDLPPRWIKAWLSATVVSEYSSKRSAGARHVGTWRKRLCNIVNSRCNNLSQYVYEMFQKNTAAEIRRDIKKKGSEETAIEYS